MSISATEVKELRQRTGAGMMDCKRALTETSGDFEKAIDYLRKKGVAKAAKKAGRETKEGSVVSYIHAGGKIGVLLEVNCETDFVARTDQFKEFVNGVAMHIAAAAPQWKVPEDVPAEILSKEREIFIDQMKAQGKPEKVLEKIADGKINKFYSENCLLKQQYVKNPDQSIEQLQQEVITKLGENLTIRRFTRFSIGE